MGEYKPQDYPFLEMDLLEERDELLENEIPPLDAALSEALEKLEFTRTAPLEMIARRECRHLCNPCWIREGRLDPARTKHRDCVFAAEFAAFRAGMPDTPLPSEEYRSIPPPEEIRAHLVRRANHEVEEIRRKLEPLYARLASIHAEIGKLHAAGPKQ